MAILNIDANGLGKPLFEGTNTYRQKDDAGDNKVSGAYVHQAIEFSATEANEWQSLFTFVTNVMKSGGGALAVVNKTGSSLSAGPVRASGWDASSQSFTVVASDAAGSNAAQMLLLGSLANNAAGVAYVGGTWTSNIDTTGSSIGASVYLKPGGGVQLTAPNGVDQIVQIIGEVQTLASPGIISGYVQSPAKLGRSWLQIGVTTVGSDANLNTEGGALSLNALSSGQRNTAFGEEAGRGNTSGSDNTYVGYLAGPGVATTGQNVYVGASSGTGATGGNNVVVGQGTANGLVNGTDNTLLGRAANCTNTTGSIALGSGASATANGQCVIGGNSFPCTDLYLGNGVTNGTPSQNVYIHAPGITGAGTPSSLNICGGLGHGAAGGDVNLMADPGTGVLAVVCSATRDGALFFAGLPTTSHPGLPSANSARIFYDSTLQQLRFAENTGAYKSLQCFATKLISGAYAPSQDDDVLRCDATSAGFTVTLPAASGVNGRKYTLKKIDSTGNTVTIAGNVAGEKIDGATTVSLSVQYAAYTVQSNGSTWDIIAKV